MEKGEIRVEYVPIDSIEPYENNAREHGKTDIAAIKSSIEQFGFNDPIGIWHKTIVEGHGRLLAAKALGMSVVPIIRLDHLTDEQRKAYALAHNKTAELSGWDFETLGTELSELKDFDMGAFGFDVSALSEMPVAQEDDFAPDIPEEPATQSGEIWVLGNHRLMCGDSSNPEDLSNLMGGVKADLVFTDPPYGVAIGDKNKMLDSVQKAGRITENIEGDTLGTEELYAILVAAFSNLREHCTDECSYYVTSPQGGEIGLMMMMMMKDAGLAVRHNLIWEKSSATFSMGRLDYDYKHESIFYTWTKRHNFYGKGQFRNTVWQFQKPRKCDLHPTMKPVELVAECLLNSSKEGDIVADIFGGSGTTIIACEQLGRSCRMMEKDPHYCDVIINRWETLTGEKAKKLSESA